MGGGGEVDLDGFCGRLGLGGEGESGGKGEDRDPDEFEAAFEARERLKKRVFPCLAAFERNVVRVWSGAYDRRLFCGT